MDSIDYRFIFCIFKTIFILNQHAMGYKNDPKNTNQLIDICYSYNSLN